MPPTDDQEGLPSWLNWLFLAGVALAGVSAVEAVNPRAALLLAAIIVFGTVSLQEFPGRTQAFSRELTALGKLIQRKPTATPSPGGGGGGIDPPRELPNTSAGAYVQPFPGGTYDNKHWDGGLAVDVMAPSGSPVYAPIGGRIVGAVYSKGGNTATLYGSDGLVYYFAHLLTPISSGLVTAGERFASVGASGNATRQRPDGTWESIFHTHFAISDQAHGISGDGTGTITPWAWLNRLLGR